MPPLPNFGVAGPQNLFQLNGQVMNLMQYNQLFQNPAYQQQPTTNPKPLDLCSNSYKYYNQIIVIPRATITTTMYQFLTLKTPKHGNGAISVVENKVLTAKAIGVVVMEIAMLNL